MKTILASFSFFLHCLVCSFSPHFFLEFVALRAFWSRCAFYTVYDLRYLGSGVSVLLMRDEKLKIYEELAIRFRCVW
ncbi:UNVERIFIED_CONTAM: hypothetical protein Sindi_1008200, partial [Sesamum indicum]